MGTMLITSRTMSTVRTSLPTSLYERSLINAFVLLEKYLAAVSTPLLAQSASET